MKSMKYIAQSKATRFLLILVLLRCCASFIVVPNSHLILLQPQSHIQKQPLPQRRQHGKTKLQQAIISSSTSGPISLKSAAIPLLDAGKAFARTGELIIDMTTAMNVYGGALSSVGANIRNAGDNIAQAAASCRFKTAQELVIDEIREASSALLEGTSKLQLAVDEANTDQNDALASAIGTFIRSAIFWAKSSYILNVNCIMLVS